MKKLTVAFAVLVLALVSAGCGNGDEEGGSGDTQAAPVSLPGTTNNHGAKTAANDMEVELDDFYFGPTFIKAKVGEKITVELHNEGQATHTFTTNEVDEQLAPGARKTVTITAPAAGAAVFYCRFHQSQGMQGAVYIG